MIGQHPQGRTHGLGSQIGRLAPRTVEARKLAKRTIYEKMATHHGSQIHSELVMDNVLKEINKVKSKGKKAVEHRLKQIGKDIQIGKFPGVIMP
jgi:hypothetical protein